MINFKKFKLKNGLKVIVHTDKSTPIVAMNILYNVGARDESPDKTGFAHLFEHLMFGGSKNIPNFDTPLEKAGGDNNAFTTNDITNYYLTIPKENLETAFWLESDRMLDLAFTPRSLEVQKQVVIEEFKQSYLNQPYGDLWMLLKPLAYKKHPYRWNTIGEEISHIENANMDHVKDFYKRFYNPNNAIMVLAGNIDLEEAQKLSTKWFDNIPSGPKNERSLPIEPVQQVARRQQVDRDVPADMLVMAFHMCDRLSSDYHATDLISDILSGGSSSRLNRKLIKEQALFSELDAFIMGDMDPGLFVFLGKPNSGVSLKEAEKALWQEIELLKSEQLKVSELIKVKNKVESTLIFEKVSVLNKAMSLAYFELISDAEDINNEIEKYKLVTPEKIHTIAKNIFSKENSNTLFYQKQKPNDSK